MSRECILSPCAEHRFYLKVPTESPGKNSVVFFMCNPSTADAEKNDATMDVCVEFAKRWGYAFVEVVNVYSYRSRNPQILKQKRYPTRLTENQQYIFDTCKPGKLVVCAWGTIAEADVANEYARQLIAIGCKLQCLGLTVGGAPKHPLYVKRSTPLVDYPAEVRHV